MEEDKKGQALVTRVFLGLIILFVVIIGIVAIVEWNSSGRSGFGASLESAVSDVSSGFMAVLGPTLGFLLNFGDDANTNFLMVLTFILISIVIVGTLDSVNIFGEDTPSKMANFAIGIIVAIIGVRFMPENMWISLTAPSSAFVATILVGIPFAALFFVTMKIKFNLARKLLWLFYLVFMSYLIFFPEGGANAFTWIYLIFLVLAAIMMFFDAAVRKFWYREKRKKEVEDLKENVNLLERQNLRKELKQLQEIIGDSLTSTEERTKAKKRISQIQKTLQEIAE